MLGDKDARVCSGSEVFHRRQGASGPWVVFSHATGADHDSFAPQVDSLVRSGWQVLSWDLPGHGDSQPAVRDVDMTALADLMVALVREVAGQNVQVVLVGHSFGGYLSQYVALRHPDLVRAVVAIGCTSVTLYPRRWQLLLLRLSTVAFRASPALVRRKMVARTGCARRSTRAYLRRTAARASPQGLVSVWQELSRCLRDEPDTRLACPVLIAHGQYDRTGIIASAARLWAARHENTRYEVVPYAGHHAQLDNAGFVTDLLTRFLADLEARQSGAGSET
jgi:3-oxoadipate enol-lactonase